MPGKTKVKAISEPTTNEDFIREAILAAHPINFIITEEENRFIQTLVKVLENLREEENQTVILYEWSLVTQQLCKEAMPKSKDARKREINSRGADFIGDIIKIRNDLTDTGANNSGALIIRDAHKILTNPMAITTVKEMVYQYKEKDVEIPALIMFFVMPIAHVPMELSSMSNIIEFKYLNDDEITDCFNRCSTILKEKKKQESNKNQIDWDDKIIKDELHQCIRAAQGLPKNQLIMGMITSFTRYKCIKSDFLKDIKKNLVKKSNLLEIWEPESLSNVGGMDKMKEWLEIRKAAWTERGQKFGLPTPKGLLLVGIQGCGKSLASKAISSVWNLDHYKLDIGSLFSSAVGSSEQLTRKMIRTIEAAAPCVLFLDEIDKGLSGSTSSDASDAGTTARVIGTILQWLSDKTSPVFVVATANNVDRLPAELLRKGRFDEIFFVGLPTAEERKEIFRIHLRKRNYDPKDFDIEELGGNFSKELSGAEIEQVIVDAMYKACAQNADTLTNTHLKSECQSTIPLFQTCRDQVEKIIDWVSLDKEKRDGCKAKFASSTYVNELLGEETTPNKKVSFKIKGKGKAK